MFWKQDDTDYVGEFTNQVSPLVWSGDREAIRELFSHLGAKAMLGSRSPEFTRSRLREALQEALLEPNRKVRRDVFRDRYLVK